MTSTNQDQSIQKGDGDPSGNSDSLPEKRPPNKSATTPDEPSFGWSAYAERVNGRFAMIGFIAILIIEAFSQNSFLHWAGIIP